MRDTLASKTIQVALMFAGLGVLMILADSVVDAVKGGGLRYVPEFFLLLSTMFVALAGKQGADNFIAYRERSSEREFSSQVPPNAPPQPVILQ